MSVILFIAAAVIGVFALSSAEKRRELGVWPFKPLATSHDHFSLSNGGVVFIDGLEERHLTHGDGLIYYTYSYRDCNSVALERFGGSYSLEGKGRHPDVYVIDKIIVCPNPQGTVLHVRTSFGNWKDYPIVFPIARSTGSGQIKVEATFLKPNDEARIRASLDEFEREHWDISLYLRRFDPLTRHLFVLCNARRQRYLELELSEDGNNIHLLGVYDGDPG